jgi:hypothetical protein
VERIGRYRMVIISIQGEEQRKDIDSPRAVLDSYVIDQSLISFRRKASPGPFIFRRTG